MSDQTSPPVNPYPEPYAPPQGVPLGPDPRKLLALFFAALAIIAVVVLVVANYGPEGGNTPQGTLEDYADALNDGDVRGMFDQTVLSLSPEYESWLELSGETVLQGGPHLEISNVKVIDKEDFTAWQQWEAEDAIEDIRTELGKTVEDYCLLTYTAVVTYKEFGSQEFDAETLCVLIDGTWYLYLWGLA
ncbi:MAG: hypothetical protein QXQ13_06810 [Thermoplasmata archaeon]